ncbi:MAG: YigZ family protein [Thiotrichaceae bacterium]|nr:YigZ family protein [Thiotrichaceae bacterium]
MRVESSVKWSLNRLLSYLSPDNHCEFEQSIKNSRFIAKLSPIHSAPEAKAWIKSCHQKYPDARHICWAYIAGAPSGTEQSMSDDGEPSGTAGKPMLNVLQHANVGNIVVAIIRYFGGVKLGTGGLARAYSSSTVEVLKLAQLSVTEKQLALCIQLPFADENNFRYQLKRFEGELVSIDYSDHITLHCLLNTSSYDDFLASLPHTITVTDQNDD